jgi:hypothetical protein
MAPASRAQEMNLANQAVCKQCRQGMEMVANIAPIGAEPGLVAFLCTDCGATESALIYPVNGTRQVDHEQHDGQHREKR